MGQLLGIQDLIKLTFEKIMKTRIAKFYKGRDLKILSRKYVVFISAEIGMEFEYLGRDMDDVHDEIILLNK